MTLLVRSRGARHSDTDQVRTFSNFTISRSAVISLYVFKVRNLTICL